MNTSTIVNALASVAVAHVAVLNTSSLMQAVVAYFVGGVVVHYVLATVVGPTSMNPTVDWAIVAAVAYVFYRKYKVTGAAVSVVGPAVISMVLTYLGVRF
jgi:hypothetical protein